MRRSAVEAVCITNPVSIAYLTGFRSEPHERLMALAVGGGEATLLLPDLERENAERHASGVEVRGWKDGEDPFRLLSQLLGRPGRLGVEKEHLTLARWESLDAPDVLDCGAAIREMRAVKGPDELERMARAAAITDEVTERVIADLRPGLSEREVAARIEALMAAAGAEPAFPTIVQSGPNSALPHLPPGGRRLAAGDLVLMDFGARHEGYDADTSRTVVLGRPSARQVEVHAAVLAAHDAAVAAIQEGVACGDVDAAARDVIREAGLAEYFIHRTGHGLGMEAHEEPNLTPGSDRRLQSGNVVTVEPGVYIPAWGGVRIEDDIVVEPAGARSLTQAQRNLIVIAV